VLMCSCARVRVPVCGMDVCSEWCPRLRSLWHGKGGVYASCKVLALVMRACGPSGEVTVLGTRLEGSCGGDGSCVTPMQGVWILYVGRAVKGLQEPGGLAPFLNGGAAA